MSGEKSIRLGESSAYRVSAISRHFTFGMFHQASRDTSQNRSSWVMHAVAALRPRVAVLTLSLVVSALLTAAALRLPDQHWLAWISFLPLFVVVRSLRPFGATLAGGFWGGCLCVFWVYLFRSAGANPAIHLTATSLSASVLLLLTLLIVISGVCVGLATRRARAIGYKLLILALGWCLVEAVLHLYNLFGPHDGLLTGSQGGGVPIHWLARLLGYVGTAFLVACVNAVLIGMVSRVRLSFWGYRSFARSADIGKSVLSDTFLLIQSWTLRQANPRAPPA